MVNYTTYRNKLGWSIGEVAHYIIRSYFRLKYPV